MPQLVPTKDDLDRMTPAQRKRARRAVWAILAETDRYVERQHHSHDLMHLWGESVRERARVLEAHIARDPDDVINARRIALMEAIS